MISPMRNDRDRAAVAPARCGGRRREVDVRNLVRDGVINVLSTGCQWRYIPRIRINAEIVRKLSGVIVDDLLLTALMTPFTRLRTSTSRGRPPHRAGATRGAISISSASVRSLRVLG